MKTSLPALLILFLLAGGGCRRNPEDERMSAPPPPPAAMIAPVRESMALDDKLARLETELREALRSDDVDDRMVARVFRAEAITDRLLEADPPYAWLAADYDVEAMLRQLQALADRIVAQVRRDGDDAAIRSEILRLLEQVGALREALAEPGGGPAPPPLDSLLVWSRSDTLPARFIGEGATGE